MGVQERFAANGLLLGMEGVAAGFYPYAELKHTWRAGGSAIRFRISDYLADAPPQVIDSLSIRLLSRVRGIRCSDDRSRPYLDYSRSRELWSAKRDLYLSRAKSLSLESRGRARNLDDVFHYINSLYFRGSVSMPQLAWCSESPARRLGWYFEPLDLLAVNRVFDSDRVPRCALEFVMYHELLHHVRGDVSGGSRKVHHDKEFRIAERRFRQFEAADRWLSALVRRRTDG